MQERAQDIIVLTRSAWQTPTPADRPSGPETAKRRPHGLGAPFEARRPAERMRRHEARQPA
ncbi:MAG: hypothetical protein L6Q75_16835 [Burkholderiaceae bacterium]|nr:hypothetical protein [Burkholderiaceae bacterium]